MGVNIFVNPIQEKMSRLQIYLTSLMRFVIFTGDCYQQPGYGEEFLSVRKEWLTADYLWPLFILKPLAEHGYNYYCQLKRKSVETEGRCSAVNKAISELPIEHRLCWKFHQSLLRLW